MEYGQVTGNVFDEMGQFWAEMADKNQTKRQIQLLKTQLKPEGYVLDIACGTGRHMIALSEAGFDMVGLDVSATLLKIAKKHGAMQLVRGDMRYLPFKEGIFSAAISMDTSFGYLPSEKADLQSLTEVRKALCRDGEYVLDVFNRENLFAKYGEKASVPKLREYPNFTLQQERTVTEDGNQLCDLWTICDKATGQVKIFNHTVRLYKRIQLEEYLAKAGFAIKSIYGDYEGQPFSAETSRLILRANAK